MCQFHLSDISLWIYEIKVVFILKCYLRTCVCVYFVSNFSVRDFYPPYISKAYFSYALLNQSLISVRNREDFENGALTDFWVSSGFRNPHAVTNCFTFDTRCSRWICPLNALRATFWSYSASKDKFICNQIIAHAWSDYWKWFIVVIDRNYAIIEKRLS